MDKSNYESAGAQFKDAAAELGISFALNVGSPTMAYHQAILTLAAFSTAFLTSSSNSLSITISEVETRPAKS
jgi:hypothetical protein